MYSLRYNEMDDKTLADFDPSVLSHIYPEEMIEAALLQMSNPKGKERRVRLIGEKAMISFLLLMNLSPHLNQSQVFREMARSFRRVHPDLAPPTAAALSYQRERIGVEPLRWLFEQQCKPLCHPKTPGAFYRGMRIMAMDGTLQPVAESKANRRAIASSKNAQGPGPYPYLRAVVLVECGSHAVVDAALGDYLWAEDHGAQDLLRSVAPGMLITHDAGMCSGALWEAIQEQGAEVLACLPSTHLKGVEQRLPDGSYLTTLHPSRDVIYRMKEPMVLRVIEYQITDERLGEPGKRYRLVTTLLDPQTAPLKELIALYHERWEVELVFDEIKTHQRLGKKTLRSKTPKGVKQEFYALLLAHYAVRAFMVQAATLLEVEPRRISFVETVFEVKHLIQDELQFEPEARMMFMLFLITNLKRCILPWRTLEVKPRVLKQLYRKYKVKKRDHPPIEPFDPDDVFLDFVEIVV